MGLSEGIVGFALRFCGREATFAPPKLFQMKTLFAVGSLVVFVAVSAVAQDYAIKIQQPLKVGQRYKFTAVASDSSENSMTSGQQVLKSQKEELSLEMESEATVLAIDSKGRPTKESHTILKLLEGPEKKPMLAAGTKVIASRPGQKTVFEVGASRLLVRLPKGWTWRWRSLQGARPTTRSSAPRNARRLEIAGR